MARRRAPRAQLRDELRGGFRAFDRGRRRLHRERTYRGSEPRSASRAPRSRRREYVRIWQPRGLLARAAYLPRARSADDGVRLRARARAQSAGGAGDPKGRLRRLLPRLALGQALRACGGDRARGDCARRRLARAQHWRASGGLVLPLRAQHQHAAPPRRGRRLPLRQRRLQRRTPILGRGGRASASGGALYPHQQRHEVRPRRVRDIG